MAFENRNYLIISTSELNKINFDEVLETSEETLRLSNDASKTFIKWDTNTPSFISQLNTKEGPYTHSEILTILSGDEWAGNTDYVIGT